MSESTMTDAAAAPTAAQPPVETTSVIPATEALATEPAPAPTSSEPLKNLTPDQVLEEIKKNGYFDALRRQLFEAFTASPPSAQTTSQAAHVAVAPGTTPSHSGTQDPSNVQTSPAPIQPIPSTTTASTTASPNTVSPTTTTTTITTQPPSSDPQPLDISIKSNFTTFLATPLRDQVEKEHDRLRFLDPRGQQDDLLKLLESDTVFYPQQETLGEATIYDLLVHSLTSNGTLSKEGRLGKEMQQKINEVIVEMSKNKDEVEDEEDDEDEEGEGDDEEVDAAGETKTEQPPQTGTEVQTQSQPSKMEED